MRRLHSSFLALAPFAMAFVALFAASSCKSRGGDTCSGTAETCADEHTKLMCRHDRYQAVKCDGPKGCKVDGEKARCDFSGNKVGTDCDESTLGRRMCRDAKSALGCRDNKYAISECKGPAGCTATGPEGDAPVKDCDTSVAKLGDECDRAFTVKPACDVDGKQELVCAKDGKFAFLHHCRGPKGCVSKGGEAVCDGSVQEIADPCTPPIPEVCSTDGAAMLLCNGTNIFEKICPGPLHCFTNQNGIACDNAIPYDGSPCEKQGQRACAKTEKENDKLLECNGKKFVVAKKCGPKGCLYTRPNTYACKE